MLSENFSKHLYKKINPHTKKLRAGHFGVGVKPLFLLGIAAVLLFQGGSALAFSGQVSAEKANWQATEMPSFQVSAASEQAGVWGKVKEFVLPTDFAQQLEVRVISPKDEVKDLREGEDFEIVGSPGDQKIALQDNLLSVPGRYKMEVRTPGETEVLVQEFTWGVLAINPNKSIYTPGEEARLAMAVLDEKGAMVCDASLKLKIKNEKLKIDDELSTANGKIIVNQDVCNSHNFTLEPDYAADYQFGAAGIYALELEAVTSNGTYSILDSVEVREEVPFDVERITATRIYPPEKYPVTLNILANEDFDGEIKETVPASFEISKMEKEGIKYFDEEKTEGELKTLIWKVEIKKGEKISLGYKFDAPDISPEFYLLGPLQFWKDNFLLGTSLVFQEARQWQIASDAPSQVYDGTEVAATLRPGQHKVVRTTNGTNGKRTFALFYSANEVITLYYSDDPEAGSPTWSSVGTVSTGGNDESADMEWDTTNNVLYIAYGRETPADAAASDVNYKRVSALNETPAIGAETVALNASSSVNFTHPVIEIGYDSGAAAILIYATFYSNALNASAIYLSSTQTLNADAPTFTTTANIKAWTAAAVSGVISVDRTNNNKTVIFYNNGVDLLATQQLDSADANATASYCTLGGATCAGVTTISADSMAGKMTGSIFGVPNSDAIWFSWLDSAFDINTRRYNGSTLDTELVPVAGATVVLGPAIVGNSANLYLVYQKVSDTTVLVYQSRSLTDGTSAWSGTETTLEDHASENLTYPSIGEVMNQYYLDIVYTTATNAIVRHTSASLAPPITISGGCFTNAGEGTPCIDGGAGDQIKVAVNGVPDAGSDGTVDGSWTFTITQPASGAILVFYRDGAPTAAEKATTVVKYDGDGGDVTNVKMYQSMLVIGADAGSANSDQTITNTDLDTTGNGYEYSDDTDVVYGVDTGTLTVDQGAGLTETLYIISGDTYRPDSAGGDTVTTHHLYIEGTLTPDSNTVNVGGNYTNAGTLTASASTFDFTSTSGTQTLNSGGTGAGKYFNNISHTGFGVLQLSTNALSTGGTFLNNGGNFDTNTKATTFTGLATIQAGEYLASSATQTFNGGITLTGGTFTGSSGDVDVNGDVTITTGTFTAPSGTFTISGNYSNAGTFTAGSNTATFDKEPTGWGDADSGSISYNSGGTYIDTAYAITLNTAGNIYVAGSNNTASEGYNFRINKYNSSGDLATGWGDADSGSISYNSGGTYDDIARAITLDTSGNIYVAGTSSTASAGNNFRINKYNSSGDLATGWGDADSGSISYNSGGTYGDIANAITLDTAGNIYVAGSSTTASEGYNFRINKYNSSGDLATGWGDADSGSISYNSGGTYIDTAYAITLDTAGNIYVAGYSDTASAGDNFRINKYDANGDLATGWGDADSGSISYNSGGTYADTAYAITLNTAGNIYVAGTSSTASEGNNFRINKYDANGDLATGWGDADSGSISYNSSGASSDIAQAITLDTSGNIYVAGTSSTASEGYNFRINKYDANGDLATGWGDADSGSISYNSGGTYIDIAYAITLDTAGNIYVAGYNSTASEGNNFRINKYDANGNLSSGGNGLQTLDSGGTTPGKIFYNLTHSGSGTLQLVTNDIHIDGTFNNSAGTFDTNSLDQIYSGNFNNTATFTAGSTTATLNGSAAQTLYGTLTSTSAFNDLIVTNDSTSGVTFDDDTTVTGTFTDNTPNSKLIFTTTKTFAFANIDIDGTSGNNVIMTSTNVSPGSPAGLQWFFNVTQASPTVSYVTVYDSDALGGNEIIATNNGVGIDFNNEHWLFEIVIVAPGGQNTFEGKIILDGSVTFQ